MALAGLPFGDGVEFVLSEDSLISASFVGLADDLALKWKPCPSRLVLCALDGRGGHSELSGFLRLPGVGGGLLLVDGSCEGFVVGAGAVFVVVLSVDRVYAVAYTGASRITWNPPHGVVDSGLVEIVALVDALQRIGSIMFCRCPSLRSVDSLTLVVDRITLFETMIIVLNSPRSLHKYAPAFGRLLLCALSFLSRCLRGSAGFQCAFKCIRVEHRIAAGVHVTDGHAWWPLDVDGVSRTGVRSGYVRDGRDLRGVEAESDDLAGLSRAMMGVVLSRLPDTSIAAEVEFTLRSDEGR